MKFYTRETRIVWLAVMTFIVVTLIETGVSEWNSMVREGELLKNQATYTYMAMSSKTEEITKLHDNNNDTLALLYNELQNYYNNTDDEIFKGVFNEYFPSEDEFKSDISGSMVKIYGLLETFPELMNNKTINDLLCTFENNNTKLEVKLSEYDELVSDYIVEVDKYNNTTYCKIHPNKKIDIE